MGGKKRNKFKGRELEKDRNDKEKEENEKSTLEKGNEETDLHRETEHALNNGNEAALKKANKETELKEKNEPIELKGNTINNEIKSTAIVKYSVPRPPDYIKLQCNTDLNLPPANWLSSSADSYGLQRAFTLTHKGFSRMAQLYPDCVGDVDVISDAENIKKLLKIPYTKEVVSMFVHRVGNTLLLDNFDIYKSFFNLARSEDGIFLWLRDFVMKNLSSKALQDERRLYAQDRTREALRHRSLISKFMYHSLDMKTGERMLENEVNHAHSSRNPEHPILPNPSPDVEAPDSTFDDKYNRNVVWTFEDIEMLLGTDMPIFGGGEYPCISLRLRDMQQPINILTGIDYWLDNLMSNVPEVVMCYHLNGFVQKYDLIKTEDLPRLKNSKFSPELIKDVAQNILSFLKTNATKAGHTYWLFKEKGEDVVKLYDLTCLVPQNDKVQNPFTIPVAMLLYRVARNFMKSEKKKSGIIITLLENAIKLLSQDKYPEIVSSSYFMLSEVYMPITTNPESPTFDNEDQSNDQVFNTDEEKNEEAIKTLDLESRSENKRNYFKPPSPSKNSAEERCTKALCHITKGLNCLQYFPDEQSEPFPSGMPSAKSSEPIPMGYEKLGGSKEKAEGVKKGKSRKKKNKKQDLSPAMVVSNKKTEPLPTWKQKNVRPDGISWKTHLKILLYEKAILVFATLLEYYYGRGQYGECLKNIRLLARCSIIMKSLRGSNQFSEDCLLGRAGDCCIRMFQEPGPPSDLSAYREKIYSHSEMESEMLAQIMIDEDQVCPPNLKCLYDCDFESSEAVIQLAVTCYEEALKVSETPELLRRLGNSLNEIGSYYLNIAKTFEGETIREWTKKAEIHLFRALNVFQKIKDKENIALLNTNLGHMYRLIAYSYSIPGRATSPEEKASFIKCNEHFRTALKTLGKRATSPIIWDNITWDLSSSLFTEACLLDDNAPDAKEQLDYYSVVWKAMEDALDSCDLDESHSKIRQFQNRAAVIYHRMIDIQGIIYSAIENPNTRQNSSGRVIGFHHNAIKFCFKAKMVGAYFNAKLKLIDYLELLATEYTSIVNKCELAEKSLEMAIDMLEMLEPMANEEIEYDPEEVDYYLKGLMVRLQNLLKNALKMLSTKENPCREFLEVVEKYKKCYKYILIYDEKKDTLVNFMYDTLYKFKITLDG